MKYLLIKLDTNWADEFDVNAFWVTTDEEFEDWKQMLQKCDIHEGNEICFGTNEYITFDSYEEIIDSLTLIELEEKFALDLIDLFGSSYGLVDLPYFPEQLGYDYSEEKEND
jgi:hypothetical protein